FEAGVQFFQADNGVWLVAGVPVEWLTKVADTVS
ncbi:RNA--NAD 2'-phosphotransferase, partial [Pseudomonas syringae pv. actinidiae]|nr:RNA--NAD 2'-phosphotransferase [Pseudomonas syringae pv. actinidiae]